MKVIKAFPFAYDGFTVTQIAVGDTFPAAGQKVAEGTINGLAAAGYLDSADNNAVPPEEELNRRIIESLDRRLAAASDQDLKDIIARSGTPYSGNMVHAHLVFAAKQQLLAEADGAIPVIGINPNAGVTEQPLAAPGAPTPPSAAAAVEQQKAEAEAGKRDDATRFEDAKTEDARAKAAGENKATDQFGQPLPSGVSTDKPKLDELTVAELKDLAEKEGVDLGDATKKADIVAAIEKAGKA